MKKIFCLILSALLLLTLLCGCGGSSAKSESYSMPSYANSGAAADYAKDDGAGWLMDTAMPAEEAAKAVSTSARTGSSLPENVKLIYRANIELESTEFDAALNGLDALVSEMGGYYESSNLNNYHSYRQGSYVVRLPAENFDAFCAAVGGLAQVNSINRSAEDISERYYDTEARLVTQQTKLERLQDLLRQAEEMEDIITLESAISETELTIENLTGTLRKYDSLVGYSTISISLTEVYKLTEIDEPVIGFGAKLAAAFRSGAKGFVNGLQNFLLSVARNWTGWLFFLIIVAVVVIVVLRIRRRRKARSAARSAWTPQTPQPPQTPPQTPQEPRQ